MFIGHYGPSFAFKGCSASHSTVTTVHRCSACGRRHPSRVADVTSLAADKPEATAGRMPFWL